jgi:hypothetical protein
MPLTRTTHWDTQEFHDYLLNYADVPFAWGTNDCCISAADAILSFTGVDLADDVRGKYHDAASAFALLKSLTGVSKPTAADACDHAAKRHGLVEYKYPLMAKRGDLVVAQNGDTLIAAVVHLNGSHVISVNELGLVRLNINYVVRAWSV